MFAHTPAVVRRSPGPDTSMRAMARGAAPARPVPGCVCGGDCPRCLAVGGLHATGGPIVQRQPLDDTAPVPVDTWSPDLIWIVVSTATRDCFGFASPFDRSLYSSCRPQIKPPFCQSARLPFDIRFLVDRGDSPIRPPFTPPKLRVQMQFHTTSGRQTLNTDVSDPSPRYAGENQPLVTSFGQDFPVGSNDSGTLTMRIEMMGAQGYDVVYTDTIEFVVVPCT